MPRRARVTLPNVAHHIIQRGNNRSACFYATQDYQRYLQWLKHYALEHQCRVHAYVLMTNHVHLLLTPLLPESLAGLMKNLGQRYVQYVNRTYQRSGTLWEGRFKSCIANESNYVLGCYRYIELNPLRANMVAHPGEYRWSSYRVNALGESNAMIQPHITYQALGTERQQRAQQYRALFSSEVDAALMEEIRQATSANYALGSVKFSRQVESVLGRRASPGFAGRPRSRGQTTVKHDV